MKQLQLLEDFVSLLASRLKASARKLSFDANALSCRAVYKPIVSAQSDSALR